MKTKLGYIIAKESGEGEEWTIQAKNKTHIGDIKRASQTPKPYICVPLKDMKSNSVIVVCSVHFNGSWKAEERPGIFKNNLKKVLRTVEDKKAGINFKVNVCMNADGPPVLLKKCMGVVADR